MAKQKLEKKTGRGRRRTASGEIVLAAEPVSVELVVASEFSRNVFIHSDDPILNERAPIVADNGISFLNAFEAALERLGCIAEELGALAQSSAMTVARIEAEGDRIDRLNAENRERLDELLKGTW